MANIKRANTSGITKSGAAISDVPDAPTIGAVTDTANGSTVTVAYTAAATGGAVTTFTATSTPGSFTGTGASPITVTGLTDGTAYTFTVTATNSTGSKISAASSSVTPTNFLVGAYDSIATVTVGAGGAANVEFTSIPATYTHLQLRYIGRSNRAVALNAVRLILNSDTAANYSRHSVGGDGASTAVEGVANESDMYYLGTTGSSNGANVFSVGIFDFLDYANTNKYKTIRALQGFDDNGAGRVTLNSANWRSTSAVTTIKIYPDASTNWVQYSSFALYGIKGA